MLDAFKRASKPAQEQAEKLQGLINIAREERGALSAMLKQIETHTKTLSQSEKSLQQVNEGASGATSKLEELSGKLSAIEGKTRGLENVDGRVKSLVDSVGQAEQTSQKLLAPDGELTKHRQALSRLSKQTIEVTANFDALKKERTTLDAARDGLRQAQSEMKVSADKTVALKGDFDKIRALASRLQQEHNRMKKSLRTSQEDATNTTEAVRDVEKKLRPLAELNEFSKTTEERLTTLNTLAEHVMKKIKVLENQKHTVEHAVVESNRLSEMVWNMDVQIGKLNEATQQAEQADETLNRIEQVSTEISTQLEQAQITKEGFTSDLVKLQKGRVDLSEFVKSHTERLVIERKEFDAFDRRVQALQNTMGGLERGVDALSVREKTVTAMGEKAEALGKQLGSLSGRVEELEGRGEGLTALEQRLDQAEELGRAVGKQHETLLHGRKELDALRKELDEFYRTRAEVAKSREQIGADRTAFEGFLQRVDDFRRHIPELDSRMDAISEKLSVVDEGMQKAATLVAIADDLDNQMTRIAAHQQLLEKINTRLNSLNSLSVSVDKRLEEQIARRQEAEALKNQCEGLGVQIGDAQQKMQEVTGLQQKLMPLFTQVASLKTQTDKVAATFKESQHDAAELAAQEVRMAELADRSREVATAVDERLKQVQGVSEELGRAAGIKDELAEELGRVQARQRDVTTHVKTSEEQLVRVDQQLAQLNQRHSQLSFADKKIATFEERLSDLKTLSENVERQIQMLATREAFVGSVKKSVDEVHQISQRSRADLQHVVDHRTQVDALGAQFEAALKSVGKTEERMAVIEGRKKLVDEVQLKTNLIVNVLEDVRVNLEMLTEQRAVVDHVVESMARG